MNNFEVFFYFVCFALIAGAAFALMWANVRTISMSMSTPPPHKPHPEAPEKGEEVMYVDLTREKLEQLYKNEIENK